MKIKHMVSSLVLGLACGGVAHAQTETFESCSGGVTGITSLSAASPGPCGSIVSGITFASDPGGDLYIASPGQSANATTALGVDTPIGGNDNITFASPTTTFSADFNQNVGGGSQTGAPAPFVIDTFLGGVAVGVYDFNVASGSSTFFSISSTPFDFLQISETGGFAVIDNVTFGAVPEPATWAMMIAGFGLLGVALRRRAVRVTYA